jgi:chemotaxis protein MotB
MFVLTIFMVIQFVLRETITGQESELDALASEISVLSSTLGLAEAANAELTNDLDAARSEAIAQTALIATLTADRNATAAALEAATADLEAAQSAITGFEAQVAGLLAENQTAQTAIEALQSEQSALLSEQEQLNLALATARSEIDAGAEAARLAAARREALEALVADLEQTREAQAAQLSERESAALADAAAAEAIRERLANADAELTAMTLSLEEKRREAEETLTLLAAAEAVADDLNLTIATALAAQNTAEAALAAAEAKNADLSDRLAAALLAQETLQQQVSGANDPSALREQLAAALAAKQAQEIETAQLAAALEAQQSEADRQANLLAIANSALQAEEALSAQGQREVAVLNAQVAELRQQIGNLQSLLNLATAEDTEAQIQIQELGTQLNTALARVAAEERRRAALEEAERARLEEEAARLAAEAQDLERFRSDFFGQLRDVLEGQDGVRIEGDRFVFSSEVLFQPGQAELSVLGRDEITKVAAILSEIADEIPDGIDWIIRVDGHTDNVPLTSSGRYRDNWELSQGRALSVVRYMEQSLGIPPERLAANGFGEYQPINTANTPEARAQNRRIELKLTER